MNYEIKTIRNQTYGSPDATRNVVIFTVEYTYGDFLSTAFFEFNEGTTEADILLKIESHGKELMAKSNQEYSFPKTGTIN